MNHSRQSYKYPYSEGASTPRATTVDFIQVGQQRKSGLVTQRDEDKTVMGQSAHGRQSGGFLTTTHGASGDENTCVLAPEATGGPDGAGLVPEGLPLRREITVASGDAEEDGIVLQQVLGLHDGVTGLGRSVHLGQDLFGESFSDSESR